MWSCLLLTDAGGDPVVFSGVTIVPAADPMALVDAVNRTGTEHCLIVAPVTLAHELRIAVTIVAGNRPELMLSSLVSEHAPLAILSSLALAMAATDQPAVGVELTRRLLANAWSGAWTTSVTKLNSPAPGLTQHLRSMLPGAGFLLRQAPDPAVLAAPRADDVVPIGVERVLLVQDKGVPPPIAQRLSETQSVTAVRQVALPGAWVSIYGTDGTGQLALIPADPRPLIGPITHQCPSCRQDLISPVCPFCRVVAGGAAQAVTIRRPAPPPTLPGMAPEHDPYQEPSDTQPGPARSGRPRLIAHPAQPGGPA